MLFIAALQTAPVARNYYQSIASFFQRHRYRSVEQCAEMKWSDTLQGLLRFVDGTLFEKNGLPRMWLWPLLRPGPGHTTGSFTDLRHGRGLCDVSDIQATSAAFNQLLGTLMRQVTIDVCEALSPGSGDHNWLTVDAAIIMVNAVRSTRTPFVLLGQRSAPVTDTFFVIVTFRPGCIVALWDERPPEHRLDGLLGGIPFFSASRGLSFLNAPLCFLTPATTSPSDLALNAIIIRFCLSTRVEPGAIPTPITFDFKPEYWLVRTAHVPPLVRCAVCLGAIRDRKFDFAGSSKKDNDTIKGGGHNCDRCRTSHDQEHWGGRYLICEYCSEMAIPNLPVHLTSHVVDPGAVDSDKEKTTLQNDLFPSASQTLTGPVNRCYHTVIKVANRVQDVVWTIIHPQEFMKGAQFFLDFTLSATWLEVVAPNVIVEAQQTSPVLVWDAFFRVYVRNSHCNRAKLALFAVQFALNLTGMFKQRDKSHKRELFIQSSLPFDQRLDQTICERVKVLTEMAHGLVRGEVLAWMARRLIKYLDGDQWGQVLYCSCTEGLTSDTHDFHVGHKRTRCDGPSLELALDGGIEERLSWGAFNANSTRQVKRLREYQDHLRGLSENTSLTFKAGVHVHLPK